MSTLTYALRPLALDLLATFVFVGVSAITHDPMLATVVAVAAGAGRVGYLLVKRRQIPALQWMSLGLVAVFGGASLVTHDARFMMFKPTLIYALVGASMLQPGWLKPYLPPIAHERVPAGLIVGWGYVWAGMMFATAALNLAFVWGASFAAWSLFISIFPLASKAALIAIQVTTMKRAGRRHYRAMLAGASCS